jgi:DNA (cytosine-5)-methyltransferase 1
MNHGSLFAGIGGFDLGFERAGIETAWQVEIDPYCRAVLAKHFPKAQRFEDIRACGRRNLSRVDILTGGFPCQDISNAGKREGIKGERSALWTEFARIIRELRPRYVVVENVAALLGRGVERVLGDLAARGYDTEWDCLPACAFGAPHQRDRLFIIAYAKRSQLRDKSGRIFSGWAGAPFAGHNGAQESMADATGERRELRRLPVRSRGSLQTAFDTERCGKDVADSESSRCHQQRTRQEKSILRSSPLSARLDRRSEVGHSSAPGLSKPREKEVSSAGLAAVDCTSWWSVEPNVGRVAHGIPSRVDRLKGLGNAVVPQITYWIAQRILEVDSAEFNRSVL